MTMSLLYNKVLVTWVGDKDNWLRQYGWLAGVAKLFTLFSTHRFWIRLDYHELASILFSGVHLTGCIDRLFRPLL
jgi:hypothetical protein